MRIIGIGHPVAAGDLESLQRDGRPHQIHSGPTDVEGVLRRDRSKEHLPTALRYGRPGKIDQVVEGQITLAVGQQQTAGSLHRCGGPCQRFLERLWTQDVAATSGQIDLVHRHQQRSAHRLVQAHAPAIDGCGYQSGTPRMLTRLPGMRPVAEQFRTHRQHLRDTEAVGCLSRRPQPWIPVGFLGPSDLLR